MNTQKVCRGRCPHRPAIRIISLILSFAMLLPLTAGLDFSAVAEDNYKEIWTADDLYLINTNLSGNYRLMTDLDLTEDTSENGKWNLNGNGWEPIGSDITIYGDSGFTGIFDGNNHSIIGMNINLNGEFKSDSNYGVRRLGLFENNHGIIKNLNFYNCLINAQPLFISSNTKNIYIYAGFVCGSNYGVVNNCNIYNSSIFVFAYPYNALNSYSYACAGAIAGNNSNAQIVNCSNVNGEITAIAYTTANNVNARGDVYCGGIVGYGTDSIVEQCYNMGNLKSLRSSNGDVEKASELGNVSGICAKGNIENCYNSGDLIGNKYSLNNDCCLYYNCGKENDEKIYYYYDINKNKKTLNEPQMRMQQMYQTFDFDNIWILDKGTDYPYPQLRNNRQDTKKHVESLEITLPENNEYVDTFNTDDLIVKAIYKNGNSEIINDYDISVSENKGDEKTVTVSYYGISKSFTITVHTIDSEWKTIKNPDCENAGEKVLTCKYCDKVIESELIPAKGHQVIIDVEAKAPTCTNSGNTEQSHCGVCGKVLNELKVIKPTEHNYIKNVTPPTCEEQGYTTYLCTKCGNTYVGDYKFSTGHKPATVSGYLATCTTDGLSSGKYCSVCHKTIEEQVIIKAKGHNIVIDKAVPATCAATGLTEGSHCSVCNTVIVKQEVIPAKGHTVIIDKAIAPTCTKTGLTEGSHCSVCGEIIVKQNAVNATSHKWNNGAITKPATCTESGVKTYTCTMCSETKTEPIAKINHTIVIDKAVEATCTKSGLTEGSHCSVCGEIIVKQNAVNATGHKWNNGAITKPATCIENGVKTYTCTVCGETKTEPIEKLNHTIVIDKAVEATCTKTGLTEGSHCSVCNTVIVKQEVVPAKGHTAKWQSVNGLLVKICTVCNEKISRLQFEDLGDYVIYADYVEYTSSFNKFIAGTNPPEYTLFSPTTPITRAMFVAILYRMAGNPYENGNNPHSSNPFSDVNPSAYYYNAACWALDEGITNQTTFKPNDNVTREQTARFLFAYAEANNMLGDEEYLNTDISDYPDYDSVHSWAVEPLQWANYNDMITGTSQGYINPQGATQRIHATRILYGFGKVCNIGNFE